VSLGLAIAPELAGRVRLGMLVLEGVEVRAERPELTEAIESFGRELRQRYGEAKSGEVPGVEDARTLYKSLGLDPTKTRPASEALLRRVLKGESLYRVNTLVDALNLCSLRAQLPYGLYDLAAVTPPVMLRRGAPGESYEGIRKGPVNVESRPVLADAQGPFGNPTSDSARTMITLACRRALVVVYAPGRYDTRRLQGVLDQTAATLTGACGGQVEASALVG
jgi:DNA/RNA-binding domain of Phe-tRNA-synthetase-like protein